VKLLCDLSITHAVCKIIHIFTRDPETPRSLRYTKNWCFWRRT